LAASTPLSITAQAPGQIIDQLNFRYPKGITASRRTVSATLKIASATGTFTLPALF